GAASPYPSTINVSGLNTNIVNVTVRLNQLSHSQPADLDVLLVAPGGQKTLLMSDCGWIYSIRNVSLTFDQNSTNTLPDEESPIVSGTYRPTDFPPVDTLPAPAPGGPYAANLSVFTGANPDGAWQLYVLDDTSSFS